MDNIRAFKDQLRKLVDAKGGVSQVAQLMNITQPSLSRMLNSESPIRRNYLNKLLEILEVDASSITVPKTLSIQEIEKYKNAIVDLVESSYYINVIDKDMLTDITLEIVQKLYNFNDLERSYIKLAVERDISNK